MTVDTAALVRLGTALRAAGYAFVTPTPATHARVVARDPGRMAAGLRDVFGWSRPFTPDVLPSGVFEHMAAAGVLARGGDAWRATVRFSTLGPDLFVHSAYPTTAPDAVFFGPDTYRFCTAVEAALAGGHPVRRAVDICSGAAPGAVTVARARPEADVFAADINAAALQMGDVNAALAGTGRVHNVSSDLLDGVDGALDLVVANPPYLNDPAGRAYRHGGGALGERLSLRVMDAALNRLCPGGLLVLYTGVAIVGGVDAVLDAARARLTGWDWHYREIDPDVFGEELEQPAYTHAERIAAVVLTATKP